MHSRHRHVDEGEGADAFEARDFTVINRVFDPDIEIRQTAQLPWGGHHRGHPGAVEFFSTLLAHIDSKVVPERMFVAGDAIVQVGRTVGTTKQGTAFDVEAVHIWQLRSGRVVGFQAYIDTPAMLAALEANR
ncbi:nuclear transport factor 2 family protein [Nocardia sp. NPDC049149]|uniref:nuclear transport factor 2 family protein n=1 Tax=Nocardia sp. NPDC049149 TaxID=3364315 RepID=UPI00371A1734